MIVDPNVDVFTLGLDDARLSGWFNGATGELTPHFPVAPDDVVLDLGCGDGGMAGFCATQGARLILADIDADKIAQARKSLSSFPELRLETYVTDANPLPVADATATRIICTEVLEHVDNPAAIMAELVRIGRPGALYLFSVPGTALEKLLKSLAPPQYFEKPNHIRIFEPEAFADLVRCAGLRVEHRSSLGFFWALWSLFFWQCDVPLFDKPRHPSLDSWVRTWAEVLNGKDGLRIKAALDEFMPKNQVIIAAKPHGETAKPHGAKMGEAPLTGILFECASHLADGDGCDDHLLSALAGEIERRLSHAGVTDRSPSPRLTDLRVRRAGLPDWWSEGNNLLLAAPGVNVPDLHQGWYQPPPKHSVLVLGQGCVVNQFNFDREGALIVIGDRVNFRSCTVGGTGYCTILIGEDTIATMWAQLDARNGGVILIGSDGLWARGINLLTDDMHAIRDLATGKRVNGMGGRIVIGRHVWLCTDVSVLGDVHIGPESVVGMNSFVRNATLPPNSVSVGRPAKVTRTGVTWSREDLP
jgi:acetyltransferase-like isoleucine patch superfamily enzyme/SAM-dependent methyltransferase